MLAKLRSDPPNLTSELLQNLRNLLNNRLRGIQGQNWGESLRQKLELGVENKWLGAVCAKWKVRKDVLTVYH